MKPNDLAQLALQLLAFHANPDTASDAVTADDERRARAAVAARLHVRDTLAKHLEPYPLMWLKKTSFATALAKFRVATGSPLAPRGGGDVPRGRGRPRGRPRAATTMARLVAPGQRTKVSPSVRFREDSGFEEDVEVKDEDYGNGEDPSGGQEEGHGRADYGNRAGASQETRRAEAQRALEKTLPPAAREEIAKAKRNLANIYARWEHDMTNDSDGTIDGTFT